MYYSMPLLRRFCGCRNYQSDVDQSRTEVIREQMGMTWKFWDVIRHVVFEIAQSSVLMAWE